MRITLDVKLDFHKFQFEALEKLVKLNFEKIVLEKYGSHERDMKKFAETQDQDLRAHWDRFLSILIKGKNKLFFSLSTSRTGLMSGGGGGDFSEKIMDAVIQDLRLMLTTLNENGALIFASINPEELHYQKHKVVTKFESGGSAYGWEGASDHDFLDFLPGLSWITFFGAKYVQCLGGDKLKNLEGVELLEFDGAMILQHNKKIIEVALSDLEALEDQIGSQYFFGKERAIEDLCHPSGFKDYLVSLEEEFNRKYA